MIVFTQGDAVTLILTATDGLGNPINLTGATFTTSIKGPNGVIVSFPNSQHTANSDQVNFAGQFTLTLATTDTAACGVGLNKEIVTQVVQGSSVVYYHGVGALKVNANVPLQ